VHSAPRCDPVGRSRSYRSTHLRRATTAVAAAEKALASGNIVTSSGTTVRRQRMRRRCIRVQRGSLRLCPRISPRESGTGIPRRERLTGTCGMHCRVRATENVGQRAPFVCSFVVALTDKTERVYTHVCTYTSAYTPGHLINLRRHTSDKTHA